MDDVLLFSIANANTSVLTNTFGILDSLGTTTATLNLPPGLVGTTVSGNFAAAFLFPGTSVVSGVTNPIPFTIAP
jgi:hypothetical protein